MHIYVETIEFLVITVTLIFLIRESNYAFLDKKEDVIQYVIVTSSPQQQVVASNPSE